MRDIKILILEDKPEIISERELYEYEYIDKIQNDLPDVTTETITSRNEYRDIDTIIEQFFDIAILDYDLGLFGKEKNGWIYIEKLLKKNPYCNIVLVTALDKIKEEIQNLSETIQVLISQKPNIKYIPKNSSFKNRILTHVKELISKFKARWKLQELIIDCAVEAYNRLINTQIESLRKKIDVKETPGKGDTLLLDTVTEAVIREKFAPMIHEHNIIVCTEEGGVANEVIYRIDRPMFYIFSDPLDGSSALEKWINKLIKKNPLNGSKKLKEILNDENIELWKGDYGPIKLNSPMISIVLSERHYVVGNVLVNLFTGDLYFSNDENNYQSNVHKFSESKEKEVLTFRKSLELQGDKLLLCTLQYKKYNDFKEKGEGTPKDFQFHMHFIECLQPLIPYDYDLKESFNKRRQRNDFTPGPGRILFLTNVADDYSAGVDDINEKELYSCILSSGEPLTEWVGWFAYLRHVPQLIGYCLRSGSGNICNHQAKRANIKGTMIPSEVASLFKRGMIDFEVLHTGYRGSMHNYTDSIVLFFQDDESWKKIIERKLDDRIPELFVKIEA